MLSYPGDSGWETLSQTYLICLCTVLLAVVIALYISNVLRDFNDEDPDDLPSEEYDLDADDLPSEEYDLDEDDNLKEQITEAIDYNDSDVEKMDVRGDDDGFDKNVEIDKNILKGKLRIKELESRLTEDQWEEERRVEREQLAAIFELLKQQEAKLNTQEIDERELSNQLKLYR